MKDLSVYHYSELYDMLNHINPFEHPDRIEAVEKELELRKERGEVPAFQIPKASYSFADLTDFSLVLYSVYQLLGAVSIIIFSGFIISQVIDSASISNYLVIALLILSCCSLFYGGLLLLRRIKKGVIISYLSYLIQALCLSYTIKTIVPLSDGIASDFSIFHFIPFSNLFLLVILFIFIAKSYPRKISDVWADYLSFRDEKIFMESH